MKCNIEISALIENWHIVYGFLNDCMDKFRLEGKSRVEVLLSCEEIYVNVAHYAYPGRTGNVTIKVEYNNDRKEIKIKFADSGVPFDPTKLKEPNVGDPIEKRKIGGLGIFMVKKMMNSVEYHYKSGKNNLTLTKYV